MDRRDWLITSAAVTGFALTAGLRRRKYTRDLRPKRSRIAILRADHYSDHLNEVIYEGLRLFNLDIRGKSVLLKPNIVEYIPEKPVNTDAQLIGAAAEVFLRLDAASEFVYNVPSCVNFFAKFTYRRDSRGESMRSMGGKSGVGGFWC
jgi:hypothetical protein